MVLRGAKWYHPYMKRHIMRAAAVVALAGAAALIGPASAEAHQQPYDSGVQTEHNLCVVMRPYGVGTVVNHYRITGADRQCFVCLGNDLYAYHVKFYGVWSGPWDTVLITGNSVAC